MIATIRRPRLSWRKILFLCVVVVLLTRIRPLTSADGSDARDNPATNRNALPQISTAISYDVESRPISLLEPAAVADNDLPPGWSHLLVTTKLTVADDGKIVNRDVAKVIGSFVTLFTANIEQLPDQRWRIAKLGVGSATQTAHGKAVISSTSAEPLSFLANKVLCEHEAHFARVRLRARSQTMCIVDDTTWLNRDGKHVAIIIRYGLLLNPDSGVLQTLVWQIDGDETSGYHGTVGPIEHLAAGCVAEYPLHADSSACLFGMPLNSAALAIPHIPRGFARTEIPAELRENAGRMQFTAEQAAALEITLRKVIVEK